MAQTGSISLLLRSLTSGDEQALVALHSRCWPWITRSARKRLGSMNLQSADEEDVAQEAFWGFVQSVRNQRIPQLASRHDLFALLTHIVGCKAASQVERQLAAKRGAGRVFNEAGLDAQSDVSRNSGLDQHPDTELDPSEVFVLNEYYDLYVLGLPDSLRPVAELHVAGFTNREIAQQLDCVERTVERKLAIIRKSWQEKAAAELDG